MDNPAIINLIVVKIHSVQCNDETSMDGRHSDTCVTNASLRGSKGWAWVNKPTSPDSFQLAILGSFGLVKTRPDTGHGVRILAMLGVLVQCLGYTYCISMDVGVLVARIQFQ